MSDNTKPAEKSEEKTNALAASPQPDWAVIREALKKLASPGELAKYYFTRSAAAQLKAELGTRMNIAKEALSHLTAQEKTE